MKVLLSFFLSLPIILIGQNINELEPVLGESIIKSIEAEIVDLNETERCEQFMKEFYNKYENGDFDRDKLSQSEKDNYDACSFEREGYWDVIGIGCSWYCGGGQDTNSASSELKSFGSISYSPDNIHDLSYKTAWIEGAKGYGVGEYIVYHMPPQTPRITKITIVNGYVKTEKAWKENSRVKRLKMYVNDKPVAILNLDDSRRKQSFSFEPIGISERRNWEELKSKPWWSMKFEILEVYPGDKYDDTALTEIFFDGIDVH